MPNQKILTSEDNTECLVVHKDKNDRRLRSCWVPSSWMSGAKSSTQSILKDTISPPKGEPNQEEQES